MILSIRENVFENTETIRDWSEMKKMGKDEIKGRFEMKNKEKFYDHTV